MGKIVYPKIPTSEDKRRTISVNDKEKIIELRKQGHSYNEIAYDVGCSKRSAIFICWAFFEPEKLEDYKEKRRVAEKIKYANDPAFVEKKKLDAKRSVYRRRKLGYLKDYTRAVGRVADKKRAHDPERVAKMKIYQANYKRRKRNKTI